MKKLKNLWPCLAVFLALQADSPAAQEDRYILDMLYVPLRAGQGNEYRIVNKGLPSGTRLTLLETNEESGFSRVVTQNGTEGWIRTQYLMEEPAAKDQLKALQEKFDALTGDENSLRSQLVAAQEKATASAAEAGKLRQQLDAVQKELKEIKRISSNALSLDTANRRLIKEAQVMNTRIEVLEADNQRLKDSEESEAFINGALAVLLGVVISLIVPRLRPKPRASSSWA